MAFTWVNPTTQYELATSEEMTEIQGNVTTLSASIQLPSPATTPITFVQPSADGVVIVDDIADEIQLNLDILKSENYCRGHYANECVAEHAAARDTVYYDECASLVTGANTSQKSNHHVARHTTENTSRNATHNTTIHATAYYVYKSGHNGAD